MPAILSHPLVVLLAGAILTGILVPTITRQWQDRQKELEIKTQLVSELSESIMQIVMAVQFVRARAEVAALQPSSRATIDRERINRQQREFDEAYRTWEIRSAILSTKLEAYFGRTTIPSDWTRFSELVTRFYALEGAQGAAQQADMEALHRQLMDLLGPRARLEPGWVGLKEGILRKKAEIIRRVLSERISTFESSVFDLFRTRRP